MTLKEKIADYKQKSAGKATPEMVAIMSAATADVQASIPERKIPGIGDSMPEFSLADSNAVMVNSNQLIQSGPLVVTFFRGMW